jgi:hypothetical protein
MQPLCHRSTILPLSLALLAAAGLWASATPVLGESPPTFDYPTQARVEYVNECIATHGDSLSSLYQCSCVIDRIANRLSYDDFVEAATYSKYAALPGEGGGIFRDSQHAREMAKMYRELEAEAGNACGLKKP